MDTEELMEDKFKILIKYFLDNFSLDLLIEKQSPKDWKEERARFYFSKLIELHWAIEKIEKYELYFSEFYSNSGKINDAEAVEYHWHSYIHDFYILEDRVAKIIGALKNDLSRYRIANADDTKDALEHLKTQIVKSLEEPHAIRKQLSHETTARDPNLTKAKIFRFLKERNLFQEPDLNDGVINKNYDNLIENSKKEYIDIAIHNKKGMAKMRNFFAPRFGHIFASLYGHDVSIFKM